MQFLLIAYDGTDKDAPARRQAARPAHLAGAARLRTEKKMLEGGALLNDAGEMIGSAMILDFESREAFDEWLKNDPYVTGKVWEKIEVLPFRAAQHN